jgi:hypothetical protein
MKERPGDLTEVRTVGSHGRRTRRRLDTLLAISVDEGFMKAGTNQHETANPAVLGRELGTNST